MFNRFTAKLSKWAGLPFKDLTNLLTWQDPSRVEIDNPNLLVAKATDAKGEAVAYLTAEPVFIVTNYAMSPHTSPENALQAGNSIDLALASEARNIGAGRFVIVLPNEAPSEQDEHVIRVVYRKLSQPTPITCDGECIEKQLTINPQTHTAKFN